MSALSGVAGPAPLKSMRSHAAVDIGTAPISGHATSSDLLIGQSYRPIWGSICLISEKMLHSQLTTVLLKLTESDANLIAKVVVTNFGIDLRQCIGPNRAEDGQLSVLWPVASIPAIENKRAL